MLIKDLTQANCLDLKQVWVLSLELRPHPTILYLQRHINALAVVVALLGHPCSFHGRSYALGVLVDF